MDVSRFRLECYHENPEHGVAHFGPMTISDVIFVLKQQEEDCSEFVISKVNVD